MSESSKLDAYPQNIFGDTEADGTFTDPCDAQSRLSTLRLGLRAYQRPEFADQDATMRPGQTMLEAHVHRIKKKSTIGSLLDADLEASGAFEKVREVSEQEDLTSKLDAVIATLAVVRQVESDLQSAGGSAHYSKIKSQLESKSPPGLVASRRQDNSASDLDEVHPKGEASEDTTSLAGAWAKEKHGIKWMVDSVVTILREASGGLMIEASLFLTAPTARSFATGPEIKSVEDTDTSNREVSRVDETLSNHPKNTIWDHPGQERFETGSAQQEKYDKVLADSRADWARDHRRPGTPAP